MNTPEQRPLEQTSSLGAAAEKEGLRSVLDAQPFPALAVEQATGKTVLANEAARRLGLTPSSESSPGTAFHGADAQGGKIEVARLMRHLLAQGEDSDGVELTWQSPKQTLFFRVFCRLVPDTPTRPALAILSFVDVSREKKAEASLREALEARDEFFSIATHELKDPLFALQLSIQLLRHAAEKQGEIPSHVRQHLEVSHRQADRLTRLIDNLLDVSRIVNHRLRLDPEALDLCELATDMVARMQDKAQHSGTTLEVQASEPVIGYFDRLKLEQILGNLLTNAIKYGAGRPVVVRVVGTEESAVLEVEDHGVGIAPKDQDRIFQRFERVSDSHKKASLGLGLYIVRSLVEAHGGSIGVRSEPGKGAVFRVTLPRKRLQTQAEDRD